MENVGVPVTREAVNRVMGIPKPEALRQLIDASDRRTELAARLDAIHTDFIAHMIRFYQTDPSVHEVAGAGEVFRRLRAGGIRVASDTGSAARLSTCCCAGWAGEIRGLSTPRSLATKCRAGRRIPT